MAHFLPGSGTKFHSTHFTDQFQAARLAVGQRKVFLVAQGSCSSVCQLLTSHSQRIRLLSAPRGLGVCPPTVSRKVEAASPVGWLQQPGWQPWQCEALARQGNALWCGVAWEVPRPWSDFPASGLARFMRLVFVSLTAATLDLSPARCRTAVKSGTSTGN